MIRSRLFSPVFGKPPAAKQSYLIGAEVGSFALTGNAANLLEAHKVIGGTGSFTLTSISTIITYGHELPISVGSFTLAGVDAGLVYVRKQSATVTSFTLTSIATGVLYGRKMSAGAGSFTLTGIAAGLYRGKAIVAVVGSFVETGNTANLLYGRKLATETRAYNLTGNDNVLRATRLLTSTVTTFALTGIAATIKPSRAITAATGVFTATGIDNSLLATRRTTIDVVAFSLAGGDIGLLRGFVPLEALPGAYTASGQAAGLLHRHILSISVGNIALTGQAANLLYGRTLSAVAGAFVETGIAAGLRASTRLLTASTVAYALAGADIGLSLGNASGHLLRSGRLRFKPRLRGVLAIGMSNQLSVRNSNTIVIPGIVDDRDPKEANGSPKFINNLTGTWEIRTLEYPLGSQVANGNVVAVASGGEYYCTLSNSIALSATEEYWFHAVLTQPVTGYVMDFSVSFAALSRNGNTVLT